MMTNNPHSKAAETYGKNAAALPTDQRALEGNLLLKAAHKLETLQEMLRNGKAGLEDISLAIDYNRRLWTVFTTNAADDEHDLPQNLKNNIATLGVFVFRRSIDVISDPQPEKIGVLVEINRNIAAGLLTKPRQAAE